MSDEVLKNIRAITKEKLSEAIIVEANTSAGTSSWWDRNKDDIIDQALPFSQTYKSVQQGNYLDAAGNMALGAANFLPGGGIATRLLAARRAARLAGLASGVKARAPSGPTIAPNTPPSPAAPTAPRPNPTNPTTPSPIAPTPGSTPNLPAVIPPKPNQPVPAPRPTETPQKPGVAVPKPGESTPSVTNVPKSSSKPESTGGSKGGFGRWGKWSAIAVGASELASLFGNLGNPMQQKYKFGPTRFAHPLLSQPGLPGRRQMASNFMSVVPPRPPGLVQQYNEETGTDERREAELVGRRDSKKDKSLGKKSAIFTRIIDEQKLVEKIVKRVLATKEKEKAIGVEKTPIDLNPKLKTEPKDSVQVI
jgi:hypothetical protein